ncbi:hypothetical protein [Rhizobium aegyptiacum]|uniref:hypothetical protein n=1 Tax=Rhizobium aegyptiacum TaxID=1764550 RepID=UPI0007E5323C|nr:hypothetical protein [Rhizobium aegyptiacum]
MTMNEVAPVATNETDCSTVREYFDGEVHLPATVSKEFLAEVLQHLIGKEVEFGLFHDPDRIVIAYFGGDEDHLPSLWSDGYWRIGREDAGLVFDDNEP